MVAGSLGVGNYIWIDCSELRMGDWVMGVHDTDKYPEIKSLLGIPEDEPIFIIRAKDKVAVDAIQTYGVLAFAVGASQEFVDGVNTCAAQFQVWQNEHTDIVKVPD